MTTSPPPIKKPKDVLQMWRLVQVIDTPVTPIAFSLAMVGGGPGGVRMLDMAKRFDSGESLTYT